MFLGVKDIMELQRQYHGLFQSLKWYVDSIDEIKPGIVVIHLHFEGMNHSKESISYSGIETIIVVEDKIQHIDVLRN